MAIHSSILSGEIPWTERTLAGDSLWDHKRVRKDFATKQQHICTYKCVTETLGSSPETNTTL